MCGRFTLTHDIKTIASTILQPRTVAVPASLQTNQVVPRYNIAPTQDVVAVMHDADLRFALLRWGLIPSWAKDASVGSRMINARAETLAEKPSFKRLLTAKRCLIVADGFYEWTQEPGSKYKTPMYITLANNEPFAFAGLWDTWKDSEGENVSTCTIITTDPNELMQSIHTRMPVVLPLSAREAWLSPDIHDAQHLLPLLTPYVDSPMTARPVSRLVNNASQDTAEMIA